ncbi:MAG: Deaminated glutathione amidase [Gammaproteobacteria bacterium]|nr:Deaminated glutathione amidase [Gammaproteobacteria bacterium]
MSVLKILAGQIEIPATRTGRDRNVHIERCACKIRRRLESEPADLVVLPELSSIDYSREAFGRLERLAEPLDGPSFLIYREIALRFGTTIVYGIARASDEGYFITQVVVGPDALMRGYYDKLHIAQFGASMEKDYFVPGRHLLVVELNEFRIAPIVCYDVRVPELSRTLVLKHAADLILHCGAYYRDESFTSWHAFVMARAMENQCFVLSLNRAGECYGNSILCPPWVSTGRPVEAFPPCGEEFKTCVIDHREIEQTRQQYPFLLDKLDDYQDLKCLEIKV